MTPPKPPDPSSHFPPTQWSLVERARQGESGDGSAALAMLLQRYSSALRAHLIHNRRVTPDQADDLLQGFVADKIIEQRLLNHASQRRGKLRTFLLATLDNYVVSHHRRETALKRLPVGGITELDDVDPTAAGGDPAWAFNVAWARELLAEALGRMRAECESSGRADLWAIFDGRVVLPAFEGAEPLSYESLVTRLALRSPLEACQLLTTAKRMFNRNLRAVASEYAGDDGDTDVEIEDLRRIVSTSGDTPGSKSPRKK